MKKLILLLLFPFLLTSCIQEIEECVEQDIFFEKLYKYSSDWKLEQLQISTNNNQQKTVLKGSLKIIDNGKYKTLIKVTEEDTTIQHTISFERSCQTSNQLGYMQYPNPGYSSSTALINGVFHQGGGRCSSGLINKAKGVLISQSISGPTDTSKPEVRTFQLTLSR